MYPHTHVHFAEKVLGKTSDEITLGSLFPDIIISKTLDHTTSHYSGNLIYNLLKDKLFDFTQAVITHSIEPHGLDYYGDEKFLTYERGYCFEKGKTFINETISACNIPSHMGWWKSHNIIEMGIELLISQKNSHGSSIRQAFNNSKLLETLDLYLINTYNNAPINLTKKTASFAEHIEIDSISIESLASKYNIQMLTKHNISVNQPKVACLIEKAARAVEKDIDEFFVYTTNKVSETLLHINKSYKPTNFSI